MNEARVDGRWGAAWGKRGVDAGIRFCGKELLE